MMRLVSYLWPQAPWVYTYMLQQVEYQPAKFIRWAITMPNLFTVQKRGTLKKTKRAQFMLLLAYAGWLSVVAAAIAATFLASNYLWLLFMLFAPLVSLLVLYVTTFVLQILVVSPKQNGEIKRAEHALARSSAVRIAVLGSYGKTSMKELLLTILSEGKRVKATPGNKNVLISHARWINQDVQGDEEVLVFEYGEGEPGDILRLASLSKPHYAVITGLAPAHLDHYSSLEAIADDFASIQKVVADANKRFINSTESILTDRVTGNEYSDNGGAGWAVEAVHVGFDGTKFRLVKDKRKLQLHSGLLGRHQIGPLVAAVAIAVELGLTDEQIVAGVAATLPYEHRMQARSLHGAWIIDDTYNGNIVGMRAGLTLLKELPANRRVYVTPGLVDQGIENERVHNELGRLIADANPDKAVIMKNSNTPFILSGLKAAGYSGELQIESNPLEFYTNLEHYLANGDVVMLQNDLPDSYR